MPDPKAQRNFTDPESKIMKTSSKGWDQCGNAQAVVNENQIIVAADVDEAYIATGRLKHNERVVPAPKGRIPQGLSVKEKMARKLRTKKGRAEYARRKALAEPPFGQIKHCRGFRQFLLRSMEKMKAEWKLVTLTHNLLKLFGSGAFVTN